MTSKRCRCSLALQKRKVLTKTVNPVWYRRYAHVLPDEEKLFVQPLKEIKADSRMLQALQSPPKAKDRAEELANHLRDQTDCKVRMVNDIMAGKPINKERLEQLRGETDVLKFMTTTSDSSLWRQTMDLNDRVKITLKPNSKWRLFKTNKLIREKIKRMAQEMRSIEIMMVWKKSIRTVRAVLRFGAIIADIARTTGEVFKEFNQQMEEALAKNKNEGGLFFDKSYYTASTTSQRLGQDAIMTLRNLESLRSEEDIRNAAVSLRQNKSFAAFPAQFQLYMTRVGWYVDLPPGKVIIRQGQPPNNFYFLLSGKAVSIKLLGSPVYKDGGSFDLIRVYERDATFGEDGIHDMETRTCSVLSVDNCRLLSVSIDDYFRATLMTTGGQNPAHVRYLSQMEFMRQFPMTKLITEAGNGNVILLYIPPGKLVTKKTSDSDYIIVIKKGQCRVLAEVSFYNKRKTVRVSLPPSAAPSDESCVSDLASEGDTDSMSSFFSVTAPHRKKKEPAVFHQHYSKLSSDAEHPSSHGTTIEFVKVPINITLSNSRLLPTGIEPPSYRASFCEATGRPNLLPSINSRCSLPSKPSDMTQCMDSQITLNISRSKKVKSNLSSDLSSNTSCETEKKQLTFLNVRVNIATAEEDVLTRAGSVEKIITAPRHSHIVKDRVWVFLKGLGASDVIGIEDMDLGDREEGDPLKCEVAVISEGCEAILINKNYMHSNMSPKMLAVLRSQCFIFPSEKELQEELKRQQFWKSWKESYLKEVREQKASGTH